MGFHGLLLLDIDLVSIDALFLIDLTFNHCFLNVLLVLDLIDFLSDFCRVQCGLLVGLLAELSLKILEQRLGADVNSGDLDSLEPDTLTFDDFEHLLDNGFSEQLAVRDHLSDR